MKLYLQLDTEQTMAAQAAPAYQTARALQRLAEALLEYDALDGCESDQPLDDEDGMTFGLFRITEY